MEELSVLLEVDPNSRSGVGEGQLQGEQIRERMAARNRWFQGVLLFVLKLKKKSEVSRIQFTSGIGIYLQF